MRLLLDTQIFLWCLGGPSRLPPDARHAVEAGDNSVLVSAATIWEIAVKTALRKLDITPSNISELPRLIETTGFDELPVVARHAAGVHGLPMHHRDPFDRLLIAQARIEGLTLVTVDPAIRKYEVAVL